MKNDVYDKDFPLLNKINSPKDLSGIKDLDKLCEEIRRKLINLVSKNGGHLSPNLGVVELTVALHKVFNSCDDKIIWDVGHQSYPHKMLTGRFNKIDTIRQESGLSGFTNRKESKYDIFTSGHSSVSISAALGLVESKKVLSEPGHVISVIGDGALTGGLAYEGLNNAGRAKKNFILILNDNKMSISKNVGAVARYLSAARIKPSYMKAKNIMGKILNKTPIGVKIKYFMWRSKSAVKNLIYKSNIFEDMGLAYYGPVDGHNLKEIEKVLKTVKNLRGPSVVHVITNKGKGYKFAEENPKDFHGVSCFDIPTGKRQCMAGKTFSEVFGETLCEIADKNPRLCAITAAMASGTSLSEFKSKYKPRFFDVGIAEEHAVTFAGGLSAGGMIPVFAVYSSFLQRAYDQIIHDAALQELKIILAIDRAGLTGEDGETHQGVFDVSFLNTVPNVTVLAPSFLEELKFMLSKAVCEGKNVIAVRYPRGGEFYKPTEFKYTGNSFDLYGNETSETLVITYGRIFSNAYVAMQELKSNEVSVCIMKLGIIKPLDLNAVTKACDFSNIIFFEESIKSGGIAEKFGAELLERGFRGKYVIKAVEDKFIAHASVQSQLEEFCLSAAGMVDIIKNAVRI